MSDFRVKIGFVGFVLKKQGFVQIFKILLSSQMDKIQNTYFLGFVICLQFLFSVFTGVKTCLLVQLIHTQADLAGGSLAHRGADIIPNCRDFYAFCWRSS